jgi:hypothetical protein
MEKLNLGTELKALVENLSLLLAGLSTARIAFEKSAAALPDVSAKVERAAKDAESAGKKLAELLDQLCQGNQGIAELAVYLEQGTGNGDDRAAAIGRLKVIVDQAQAGQARMAGILQYQEQSLRPLGGCCAALAEIENALKGAGAKIGGES